MHLYSSTRHTNGSKIILQKTRANPWEHILLSVEVLLVVEMAKVGIIKPSSCTPHVHHLGTKRPVIKCNFCSHYQISCIVVETCSSFEEQLITAISTCFDSITDMNSDCEPTKTIATPSALRIPLKNTPLALFESETNNLSIRHH